MVEFTIVLVVLLFTILRVGYVNGLADDWNIQLAIYIKRLENNPGVSLETIDWMKKHKIKRWKYYLRLNVWNIKDIISDPFLIQEIHRQVQNRYL